MNLQGERFARSRVFLHKALNSYTEQCILWPFALQPTGYARIGLQGKSYYAHRVVCVEAHGPPPSSEHEAAHSCGNRACMNPKHLSWKTSKDNHADRREHGTILSGEKHNEAKLTWAQVDEIRSKQGSKSQVALADEYGVTPSLICRILKGKIWKSQEDNKCV